MKVKGYYYKIAPYYMFFVEEKRNDYFSFGYAYDYAGNKRKCTMSIRVLEDPHYCEMMECLLKGDENNES